MYRWILLTVIVAVTFALAGCPPTPSNPPYPVPAANKEAEAPAVAPSPAKATVPGNGEKVVAEAMPVPAAKRPLAKNSVDTTTELLAEVRAKAESDQSPQPIRDLYRKMRQLETAGLLRLQVVPELGPHRFIRAELDPNVNGAVIWVSARAAVDLQAKEPEKVKDQVTVALGHEMLHVWLSHFDALHEFDCVRLINIEAKVEAFTVTQLVRPMVKAGGHPRQLDLDADQVFSYNGNSAQTNNWRQWIETVYFPLEGW